MANLTSEEVVALLTGGGLRGDNGGIIEGSEAYYNFDTGSFVPVSGLSGETAPAVGAVGSVVNLYGTPTTPYFKCKPGTEYTYDGHEVSGYSITLEYGARLEPGPPTIYHDTWIMHTYRFDKDGQVVEHVQSEYDKQDCDGDMIYVDCLAGYNDNNGQWNANYFITWTDQGRPKSVGFPTVLAGESFIGACTYWGAGQRPMKDDGVTPTGGSGGGGGTYSRPDETIGIPPLPSINLADLGICTIYHITPTECANFSNYLWSPGGFFDDIIKNMASPMENVISLQVVPSIPFNETSAEILIGNTDSGVVGHKLFTTFYEIDCGTINVTEYYNNFADYNTEIQIFLPFIGIRDINVNDCMAGFIKVVYHVDVFSGSCIAFIQTQVKNGAWHVIASYNGSISCSIPLSGANYMGVFNGVLGAVGSAVSGNLVGAASSLMNIKPEYQRSGNIGSMNGLLGIRYPYLIFTTPQIFTAATFRQDNGYISNLSGKLSDFIDPNNPYDQHYIQVDTDKLDLNGMVITEEERDLLYDVMNRGIYISRIREGE